MNVLCVIVIVLIVGGVLVFVYGSFSYIKDSYDLKFGFVELLVKEKEMVNILMWVGIVVIVVGGGLLVFGGRCF